MRTSAALVFVALLSCTTGPLPSPNNENSGAEPKTRLRAKLWDVEGAPLFRWFRDSARKEDCAFIQETGVANVGPGPTFWCLPTDAVTHDATGNLALFADPECSTPIALGRPTGAATYVIRRGASACLEHPRVYRAEPVQEARPWFFDGDRCVRAATAVPLQGLAEEVPIGEFVAATEVVVPLDGPIARLELVAPDGARQTIGAFDSERRLPVAVTDPGGAGDPRWFPSRLAFENAGTTIFGDDQCSTTVASKVARDAICPLGAAFVFEGSCGDGRFFELGAPFESSALRERTQFGTCAPSSQRGVLAYARGAALARSSFKGASLEEQGTGRVRLRGYSDGTATPAWTEYYDTLTKARCVPVPASDGLVRCLPVAAASVSLFSDAACTSRAFEEALGECVTPPSPTFVRDEGRGFRVERPITATYETNAGACRAHVSAVPARSFAVVEVEVTTFPLATEVTR